MPLPAHFIEREGWLSTLLVLAINRQERDGRFTASEALYNQILAEFCQAQGIDFIDPLPELLRRSGGQPVFRFPDDHHWTPAAHRLAAELVAAFLWQEKLVDPHPRAPDPGLAAPLAGVRSRCASARPWSRTVGWPSFP